MAENDLKIKVRGEFDSSGISVGLDRTGAQVTHTAQQVEDANTSLAASAEQVGDAMASASQAAEQASGATAEVGTASVSATAGMEGLAEQIALSTVTLEGLAASLEGAVSAIKAYVSESLDLANALEQTQERLTNMQLSGREAEAMVARLKQTSVDTGSSVADLASGAEILARAGGDVSASLDYVNTLATATGKSMQETALAFAMASQGNSRGLMMMQKQFGITAEMLADYGVHLNELGGVTIKTAADQAALADAIKTVIDQRYGDAIALHGKSLQGAMEDLDSTIARLKTTTGELIGPVLAQALNQMTALLKAFEALPEPVKNTATGLGLVLATASTISAALPVVTRAWGTLASMIGATATAATANTAAQTATAAATATAGTAAQAASVSYSALATSIGLVTLKLSLFVAGLYAANLAITESREAVKALQLADDEETEAIKRRTAALKDGGRAYAEITAAAEKAGGSLSRRTSAADVEKMILGGVSLSQVQAAARKARSYAEELTTFAAESPTAGNRARAAAAREQASQLAAGAEAYARYQEQAKKSLEDAAKKAEEIKKQQEEAAKAAQKAADDARKRAEAEAEAAKKKAEQAAKEAEIAKQKAIEEHTTARLGEIDLQRKRVTEAKAKTDIQALDTAIQRTKTLLRDDETIAKNAKAREMAEKHLTDLVEERRKKEQEIANLRKSAEQSLAEAQERYNQARQATLQQQLGAMTKGTKAYAEAQAELAKRREQSSLYERQEIIGKYTEKIGKAQGEDTATILKNALKYELMAQTEGKTRERLAEEQTAKEAAKPVASSASGAAAALDTVKTAGEGTTKAMESLAKVDFSGVTSALQSLTTAAMGAAGALSRLSAGSRGGGSSIYNQSVSINGQISGGDVDTNAIFERGMAKIDAQLRDRERYNDIMGG